MTDLTTLKDLLVRVEEATEPDRYFDAAIVAALFRSKSGPEWGEFAKLPNASDKCAPGKYWLSARSGDSLRTSPKISASVDAALAFMREMLPNYDFGLDDVKGAGSPSAWVSKEIGALSCTIFSAKNDSLPLAIIAATLKAIIAEKADA